MPIDSQHGRHSHDGHPDESGVPDGDQYAAVTFVYKRADHGCFADTRIATSYRDRYSATDPDDGCASAHRTSSADSHPATAADRRTERYSYTEAHPRTEALQNSQTHPSPRACFEDTQTMSR